MRSSIPSPVDAERGFALDSGVSAVFGDDPEVIRTRKNANIYHIAQTATHGLVRRIAEPGDFTLRS